MRLQTYNVETHVHTKYSHDSLLPFWLLYLKCRLCGIDYIAITEHNNIDGAVAFKDYCRKRGNKVNVIVGEEIMSQSGEIIGLFLSKPIVSGLSAKKTIEKIVEQNGIVYIPHPYDLKRYRTVLKEEHINENLELIDCIECHNGRNISLDYSKRQCEIAEKYKILKIIGSDAHTFFEIGRNYMVFHTEPNTPYSFIEGLKNAKFKQTKCITFSHILTKLDRALKLLLKGDCRGLFRILNKKFRRKV